MSERKQAKQIVLSGKHIECIQKAVLKARYDEVQDLAIHIGRLPGSSFNELKMVSGLEEYELNRRLEFLISQGMVYVEGGYYYPDDDTIISLGYPFEE